LKISTKKSFLPIVYAEGSGYKLGYEIGRQVKSQINQILSSENIWFSERNELDQEDPTFLNQILKVTQQHFPQYIEEVRGYADGADVSFRDLWVINSADHQTMQFETCTDLFLKTDKELILWHNEDFNDINSDHSYFLHLKMDNGVEIFSHAYPGALPGTSFALNSNGMCFTCNTLPNPEKTVGVSRKILDRWMLESPSINETLKRIQFFPRCGVFSYNLASLDTHCGLNIETTETGIYATEVSDYFYHTNHYLNRDFMDVPVHPTSTSEIRYNRLKELVPPVSNTPRETLKILSDPKVLSVAREIYPGWSTRSFATVIYHLIKNKMVVDIWPYSREPDSKIRVELTKN
jgi:hypothetical protein